MSEPKRDGLLGFVQTFFQDYLRGVRGASEHTVRAYRDTLKLFFSFLAHRTRRPVAELSLDDIQPAAVLAFLDHVEAQRRNCAATRNCRLAALRSFVQHLLRHDLTRADQYGRVLSIGSKRATQRVIAYLEPEEARAIIAAVNPSAPNGQRDRALLLFLYNTGARISEALAVHPRELRLDSPRQVRLYGKGAKERLCPLWPETVMALRQIIRGDSADELVFRNSRGAALTRDGVAYLLTKYVRRAAETLPDLRDRRVTPHVMRHYLPSRTMSSSRTALTDLGRNSRRVGARPPAIVRHSPMPSTDCSGTRGLGRQVCTGLALHSAGMSWQVLSPSWQVTPRDKSAWFQHARDRATAR